MPANLTTFRDRADSPRASTGNFQPSSGLIWGQPFPIDLLFHPSLVPEERRPNGLGTAAERFSDGSQRHTLFTKSLDGGVTLFGGSSYTFATASLTQCLKQFAHGRNRLPDRSGNITHENEAASFGLLYCGFLNLYENLTHRRNSSNRKIDSRGFWRPELQPEYTLAKPPGCPTNRGHLTSFSRSPSLVASSPALVTYQP